MLEEQIEHNFAQKHKQVALSMLIQSNQASELINSVNAHGRFIAEMKEWNAETHQAHILVHPAEMESVIKNPLMT